MRTATEEKMSSSERVRMGLAKGGEGEGGEGKGTGMMAPEPNWRAVRPLVQY